MNRKDFQMIATKRHQEAKALLKTRNYSGAYYLCGYIVECALKACIAKQTRRYDFPDKKTAVDSYTHNMLQLVRLAYLEKDLDAQKKSDQVFEGY